MKPRRGKFFDGTKGRVDRPRLLFVEGFDDALFFDAVLDEIAADAEMVGLNILEGKDRLAENVGNLVRSRPFVTGTIRKYAIVRDTDTDPAKAEDDVRKALQKHNHPYPGHNAFASIDAQTQVGVFLLPSNLAAGDLEQLCLDTVQDDARTDWARELLDRAEATYGNLDARSKRQAAIYLNCCPGDARGVGAAFARGVFQSNHASLNPLKDFARLLAL